MHQRLARHIDRCLATHCCVALPSVGGFVTERRPAKFDRRTGRAYPPTEELHFNAGICHRDGLLEASYARQYGLSSRRARAMLEEDIRSLRSDLVSRNSVSLGSLGTLLLSDGGNVGFEASTGERRPPSSYGLHSVSMPLVLREKPIQVAVEGKKDQDSKYFRILIPKAMVGGAAAVLLLFALLLIPFRSTISSSSYEASFIPSEVVGGKFWSKQPKAPTTQPRAKAITAQTTDPADNAPQKGHADSRAAIATASNTLGGLRCQSLPLNDDRYYVIVATFRTEKQVEDFVSMSKESLGGVLKDKKYYRIYTADFDNSAEAYKLVNRLRSDAWVFHSK